MDDKARRLLKKALREHQHGNPFVAEGLYKQIIRRAPEHVDGHYLLGTLFAERGNYDEALRYLGRAAELAPDSPMILNNLGNVHRIKNDLDQAALCYQRALALNPGMAESHCNLGIVLKRLGMLDEAIQSYSAAISLNSRMTAAHSNLGSALKERGDFEAAMECFKQVIRLDSDNLAAKHNLAALAGQTTDTAPPSYVRNLFDDYADNFEEHLSAKLGCRIPTLLREAVGSQNESGNIRFRNAVDLGCGTGLAGLEFRAIVDRLTGFDLSPRMIEQAEKKKIYDALQAGEVTHLLARSAEPFDLFVAADVFVYLGNLEPLFHAVRDSSLENALFAFSTEISDENEYLLAKTGRYAHCQSYIRSLADKHGFAVKSVQSAPIRKERDDWLIGNIFVLQHQG